MPPGRPSQPPRRVLLVEDDLDQAHLVKFLLEQGGRYSVTLAQDGLRGSMLVRDTEWDLVITDLNLPGADGMAVVEAARSSQPGTPVLATTAYSGPQYAEEAVRKGANDVMIKPLERDDLLAKVDFLVGTKEKHASSAPASATSSAAAPPDAGAPTASLSTPAPAPTAAPAPPAPPVPTEGARQIRVLAVSVRPGDAEAGCGGTLLRHRDRGDRVILLTLTHGREGPAGVHRREQSKAAGRTMGIRFFVGNAGSGDQPIEEDLKRLVHGALTEIRPDLVYLPTVHHSDRPLQLVVEEVLADTTGAPAVYAYDPGDATLEFRPRAFVGIARTLDEKLSVLNSFDGSLGAHLSAEHVAGNARFWGRFQGGNLVEAFEVVREDAPPWLEDVSLLPADESTLV